MSERECLVLAARAKGYWPTDDDTDTDLVWVIHNYRDKVTGHSRVSPHVFPGASKSNRGQQFSNACENLEEMLAVLG